MKNSVLLIDDQERFLGTLQIAINSLGYDAQISSDAQVALHLISLKHYDAIICDIQMPNTNGFEFLMKSKELTTSPVILMTGFSEIADAERAIREGAKGFISKPFTLPDIKRVLTEVIQPEVPRAKETAVLTDEDYFPLTIDEFIFGKKIQYDLFVKATANKYLKIAHGGDDLNPERIKKFKEKGLKHIYILREDYKRYVGFLLNLSSQVSQNKSLDLAKRMKILQTASDVTIKGMFLNVVKEPELAGAKQIVSCIHEMAAEDNSMFDLLESLKSSSDLLYSHAMGVSVISVMIARALQWNSHGSIASIGIAGFFHDIGKKELPKALIEKSRLQYTAEEVALYETHPVRGANLLSSNPKMPTEVIQAVLQHHEGCSGLGFPKHLTRNRIIPIAKIIAIADEFVNAVLPGPSAWPVHPSAVVKRMRDLKGDFFESEYLDALETVLVGKEAESA